jgi:ATP-dependent RNA helicase DHX29
MAKKKKTQLKPVARPFATASVPKKVVPELVVEEVPNGSAVPGDDNRGSGDGDTLDSQGSTPSTKIPAPEPESEEVKALRAEELELQGLVDKLQDKTEKEINRNIKVCVLSFSAFSPKLGVVLIVILQALEYDRRLSKSLSPLVMDHALRTRVYKLWREEEQEAEGCSCISTRSIHWTDYC